MLHEGINGIAHLDGYQPYILGEFQAVGAEAVAKGVVSDALFRLWRGESFVGFRPSAGDR